MSAPRAEAEHARPRTGFIADTLAHSCVDGPGNRFVVFFQGCDFDCIACHNPHTIPGHGWPEGHRPGHRSVASLLDEISRSVPFISGVTASGGEATQQADFVFELFAGIRSRPELTHLTRFVDSNGGCEIAVWDQLAPELDGAMIDLKCLDPSIHRSMTGVGNERVLASIEHLAGLGLLFEVRLLIVGGVNDDPALLSRTGDWLAAAAPAARIKVIGFRRHGTRPQHPPLGEPKREELEAIAQLVGADRGADVSVVCN